MVVQASRLRLPKTQAGGSRYANEHFRAIHSSPGWNIPSCSGRVVAWLGGLLFFAGCAVAEGGLPDDFGECAGAGCRSADGGVIAGRAARAPLCANRWRL